jgi:superfamily II DNA or RNA helicase
MLRDYQQKAVDEIRQHYANGVKKTLLVCPTGSGKTRMFCFVAKSAAAKGKRVLIVVRGRKLIDQASERLTREGVDHGIIMAGRKDSINKQVYVCSIDTLIARDTYPPADLIIIDEAHHAGSAGYKTFAEKYPDAFFLPVTATPYQRASIEHIAETIVAPIGMKELIDQGYLVPARMFAPEKINHRNLTMSSTGDYTEKSAYAEMTKGHIIGNIVEHWKKIAPDTKTLAFSVNVAHAHEIAAAFKAHDIPACAVSSNTSEVERLEAIKKLESGEIKVIANCGILCTGVDIPSLQTIIMARPTASEILYIQIAGRGTRTYPGKSNFILLDHASNIEKHGFITDIREASLQGRSGNKNNNNNNDVNIKTCMSCYGVVPANARICPECESPFTAQEKRDIKTLEGSLKEITEHPFATTPKNADKEILRYIRTARYKDYQPGWVYHKIKAQFGEHEARRAYSIAKTHLAGTYKKPVPSHAKHDWQDEDDDGWLD